MIRSLLCFAATVLMLAPGPLLKAQDAGAEYRQFFTEPKTVKEFWIAMQFEIDVGRYDLAAKLLHRLLDLKPTDQQLIALEEKEGIATFLKLRNVPVWSENKKEQEQAKKDVESLIEKVTTAVTNLRKDPKRIELFIKNLRESPEERAYAFRELYKSGAAVVPYLIAELRRLPAEEHLPLLDTLRRLGPDTLAPLIAALDSNEPTLQVEILDILMKRLSANKEIREAPKVVPYLWYLWASPTQAAAVRTKARQALSLFLNVDPTRLPIAKDMLVREAERYYRHQVAFPDPEGVHIWRWDGKNVVEGWPGAVAIKPTKAEEVLGLRFVGQALSLDPVYRPAQELMLSLVLDKGIEKAGLERSLATADPAIHDLLASVNADLVTEVMERAMRDKRTPVVLAAVRDLGERAEVRATRPQKNGKPPLVKALYYPDRRVQQAAAEALLRVPDTIPTPAAARVVDVLRLALAAHPEPGARRKVLLIYLNRDEADRVANLITRVGFDPVITLRAREAMQRLGKAADIDLILVEALRSDPELPFLLGQLRADSNVSRLPVLLVGPGEPDFNKPRLKLKPMSDELQEQKELWAKQQAARLFTARLRLLAARYPNVKVIPLGVTTGEQALQATLQDHIADPGSPPLTEAERKKNAEKAIQLLADIARGRRPGYDVRPAGPAVLEAIKENSLSPEGQLAALDIAARLPGLDAQSDLVAAMLDARRDMKVRTAAGVELVRHLQKYGRLLNRNQIEQLDNLARTATDAGLKAQAATVLGTMRPDVRLTGARLLDYKAPEPGAAPPPKPMK